MQKRILVLGGTGLLGQPTARRLQADGFQVRLLARDVEKAQEIFDGSYEIVTGDVAAKDSLEGAMQDCAGVHISVGGAVDELSARNVSDLAPDLGIEQITYLSGSTVAEQNAWFPMTAQKLAAEKAIEASGIPFTILRPTWPMEQLPRFVMGGRATLVGDSPITWHWFAADDLGRMVSRAFQEEAALGKRLYVHGPEAIPMAAALERYCQAFHPEIEAVNVIPIAVARQMAASTGNNILQMFAELMAYFEQVSEPGDPGPANEILGTPMITLADWIATREPSGD